jgi:hypothetical protein
MQPSNETEAEALQRRQVEALERLSEDVRMLINVAAPAVRDALADYIAAGAELRREAARTGMSD